MPYNYIVKLTIFTIISRAFLSITFRASIFFNSVKKIWSEHWFYYQITKILGKFKNNKQISYTKVYFQRWHYKTVHLSIKNRNQCDMLTWNKLKKNMGECSDKEKRLKNCVKKGWNQLTNLIYNHFVEFCRFCTYFN